MATATSSSSVALAWRDNSEGESGFHVERRTDSAPEWTSIGAVGPDVTRADDTRLPERGTFLYRVRAHRSEEVSAYSNLAEVSTPRAPRVMTSSLPDGMVGRAYAATLDATGGVGPYSWTLAAGALPHGLVLGAETGALLGIPTAAGTGAFSVQVTAGADTARAFLQLTVLDSLRVATSRLASAFVNTPYSQALATTGGSGAARWSVAGGFHR